jgi:hypothetical protein
MLVGNWTGVVFHSAKPPVFETRRQRSQGASVYTLGVKFEGWTHRGRKGAGALRQGR